MVKTQKYMLDSGSTMEIVQLIIGIVLIISVIIIISIAVFNGIRISNATEEELKFDPIKSMYKKLKKGRVPKAEKIQKHAKNVAYRTLVYDALEKYGKTNLFPSEMLSIEKSSESYLATWLNMHDDFDSFPDEIVFENTIKLQNGVTFLLFKFKVYEPHLLANKEWMTAYVGYKTEHTNAYKKPDYMLSLFENTLLSEYQLETSTKQ